MVQFSSCTDNRSSSYGQLCRSRKPKIWRKIEFLAGCNTEAAQRVRLIITELITSYRVHMYQVSWKSEGMVIFLC